MVELSDCGDVRLSACNRRKGATEGCLDELELELTALSALLTMQIKAGEIAVIGKDQQLYWAQRPSCTQNVRFSSNRYGRPLTLCTVELCGDFYMRTRAPSKSYLVRYLTFRH